MRRANSTIRSPWMRNAAIAVGNGIPVVEVNPVESELSRLASHRLRGTAATVLPALVDAVLAD